MCGYSNTKWTFTRGLPVRRRWPELRPAAALALPFVAGIVATRGLTHTLHTFHWPDEHVFHLPAILRFAHQLPGVDLGHYDVPQTPLFHLTFALYGKVV